MKMLSLRIGILLAGLAAGICCLGATPAKKASADREDLALAESKHDYAVDRWEDEEWDEEECAREEREYEDELEWHMAEQQMEAQAIQLAVEVANDELKTAVVTATLLIEHTELTTAIDTLKKAVAETNSAAVKRALRLKLMEAHLENDDPTSVASIATQLMLGE